MRIGIIIASLFVVACGGTDTFESVEDPSAAAASTGEAPPACETHVTGHVSVHNAGTQIMVVAMNKVGYGQVNTGGSLEVDVPPGTYTLEITYLDSSEACTPSMLNVSTCSSQALQCPG